MGGGEVVAGWLVQVRGAGGSGQDGGEQRGAAARVRVPAQQAVPRRRLGRELPLLPGQSALPHTPTYPLKSS